MANKLFEKKPIEETILGQIARKRAAQEPRNNLLLQLGQVNRSSKNKEKIQKEFASVEASLDLS